jgi:hypothetical protein
MPCQSSKKGQIGSGKLLSNVANIGHLQADGEHDERPEHEAFGE